MEILQWAWHPDEARDLQVGVGDSISRELNLDVREQRIPAQLTGENYFHDLRDASLYTSSPNSDKPGIPAELKLYLADHQN